MVRMISSVSLPGHAGEDLVVLETRPELVTLASSLPRDRRAKATMNYLIPVCF